MTLYRWASDIGLHGMPTPEDLEREGYVRVAQHPAYRHSWLMRKGEPINFTSSKQ